MSNSFDSSSFKLIFDNSPIPLWEMDYTKLFEYFSSLKNSKVQDFATYLKSKPEELDKCISYSVITQANRAALNLLEIDNLPESSSDYNSFFPQKNLNGLVKILVQLFKEKKQLANDLEILTKKGKSRYLRVKINIINTETNKVLGVISTEDISKLKIQEKQFIAAVSSSPDSVTINRISDGKFSFVNQTFKDNTGFSDADIENKSAFELGMWINENDRDFYINELQKNGFIQNLETSFQTKEGGIINALLSAKTIIYNGEPSFIVTSKDVTKLNKLTQNLKQSEEQFREAFMNIPDSVHINKVSDATFVDVNENFLKHTGYTRKELLGKTPHDLNIWADGVTNHSFYKPLKKNGHISNLEIIFRMKDGSLLQALISANVIELNGEPHIITVTKDMTKIKASQEKLKQNEVKFQSIFSNSPDALALMELENWTYVEVNEMFVEITGLDYQEIIGKSTFDLNLWTRKSDRAAFSSKLQNGEEIANHESLFTLGSGEEIHMLVSAKLIEVGGQKLYMIIAKNINDFVNIQKSLFEEENRYKAIVSNSYEGIAIIDDAFHFDYVNQQFETITGYTAQELLGQDFRNILTTESAAFVGERYKERQGGKETPQGYTFEVKRKSGEIRQVEIHSSVIKTADGKPQTIAQLLDITDRLSAEKANKKTAKIIEQEHKRSKQYFEVAGMIMMVLDNRGSIMAINKKGCEVLESTEDNIINKNWFSEFIPESINNEHRNRYIKSMEQEKFHDDYFENIIKTNSGKEKLIAWRNNLLKDENNKIIGVISSGEDISDKGEASRILKMSGMIAVLWKNEEKWPIEFISDNVENLFGYTPEDFYSKKIAYDQLIHTDDTDRVSHEVEAFNNDKRANYTHEPYRIITKSGKEKWINDHTTAQYDSEGNITYYYGILSDITEDILKGEKLRQSDVIIAQMNDGVIITNLLGEIITWTGEAERIFDYKNREILGENIQQLWNGDKNKDSLLETIQSDIGIYGHYQNEISCLKKRGLTIPIELTAKLLHDNTGNPLSLILVARDITNRKVAQKALEASEIRYRHIFESILDGVIIYNMKKEIVQVNKMATQMYGYSHAEFTQTTTSRYIYPTQNIRFDDVINHLGNNYEKMFEGESVDISKTGDKFFVNAKGRLIDYNNEPHLLIIVRDITHIKQVEHDIVKAKKKAIESEQLKSAFLANMSHEIRTPMNSIIGFSDLLGDDDISKDEKEHFIRIIRQNGNQLMTIINDIIDISKIEAGQIQLNYEKIDLCEVFQDIYNMFEVSTKEKKIKLILKSNHTEDEYLISTDELRLKQILINLISNALKFTKNGFIEFGCNIIDQEKSIHFYVKDTGIGISKDKQEEIFQRFMQAESKTTKLYGGTGLGLAISQGLVHTFKGKIWLDSEEGMGSTFNFVIPLIT